MAVIIHAGSIGVRSGNVSGCLCDFYRETAALECPLSANSGHKENPATMGGASFLLFNVAWVTANQTRASCQRGWPIHHRQNSCRHLTTPGR